MAVYSSASNADASVRLAEDRRDFTPAALLAKTSGVTLSPHVKLCNVITVYHLMMVM
jgi:hypothetical protein